MRLGRPIPKPRSMRSQWRRSSVVRALKGVDCCRAVGLGILRAPGAGEHARVLIDT